MLSAPLIEPSARPMADWFDGLTAPVRGAQGAAARERQPGAGAELRIDVAVEAPLDAELARGIAIELHDARFDFDLRLRPVERPHQLRGGGDAVREVADDQRVRAGIDLHVTARRQRAARDDRHEVGGLRVADRHRQRAQLAGERLRFAQLAALFVFLRQHVERHDADDVALDAVAQLVGAQDDVERLIPGHVAERHVHRALNARVDDDVQAVADLGERAEHGAQVGALEVEGHGVARELPLALIVGRLLQRRRARLRRGAVMALGIGTGSGAVLIFTGAAIIGGAGGAGGTGAASTATAATTRCSPPARPRRGRMTGSTSGDHRRFRQPALSRRALQS